MVTPLVRFRWLHITEDYDLQGINDFEFAQYIAANHGPVVDVITGIYLNQPGRKGEHIPEMDSRDYIDPETGEYWTSGR
jgi:hypothetical protein